MVLFWPESNLSSGMWLVFQSQNLPEDYGALFFYQWAIVGQWCLSDNSKEYLRHQNLLHHGSLIPCLLGQPSLSLRWSHVCLEYVNFTTLLSVWPMMDNSIHRPLFLLNTSPPFPFMDKSSNGRLYMKNWKTQYSTQTSETVRVVVIRIGYGTGFRTVGSDLLVGREIISVNPASTFTIMIE